MPSIIYGIEAQKTSTDKLLALPGCSCITPGQRTARPSLGLFPRPPLHERFKALLLKLFFHLGGKTRIAVGSNRHSIKFVIAMPEDKRWEFLLPQFLRHSRSIVL
jgi:hypothetical protein